jgi:hypothetical protein
VKAVRRILGVLVALVIASVAAPALAMTTPSFDGPGVVHAYTYDSHRHTADPIYITTERGPPTAYVHAATAYDAVAHWSRGGSAHLDGTTPPATFAYDSPAALVQTARGSQGVGEPSGSTEPGSAVAWRSDVAANTGDDVVQPPSATEHRTLDDALGPSSSITSSIRSQLRVVRTS